MPNCLEVALAYAARGKSIVPVGRNKVPIIISWAEYQRRVATEEEIKAWFGKSPDANIALVCGEISDILVIDCDSAEAVITIQEMLPESMEIPIQNTPSGGAHFFFRHAPGLVSRANAKTKIDVKTGGGYVVISPSADNRGSWSWVNGNDIFSITPPTLPRDVYEYLRAANSIYNNIKALNNNSLYKGGDSTTVLNDSKRPLKSVDDSLDDSKATVNGFELGSRDQEMFSFANALIKGGYDEDKARKVLRFFAINFCDPPWTIKEADDKLNSAINRDKRFEIEKDISLATRVRDAILSHPGNFLLSQLRSELSLLSKGEYDQMCKVIERMVREHTIERISGGKRGEYHTIDKTIETIYYKNATPGTGQKLVLPLGVSDKTIFFPRSIVVVAGVTGFGKTTFLLNVIKENMKRFNFIYFSSEMDAIALHFKLSKFDLPVDQWEFDAISDMCWDVNNIQDKIQPNAINVIDYIDPDGERAYDIGRIITNISKKLDQGMALIATQKRKDLEYSAGGVWSAKASSLYLALDFGTINIVKNRYREMDQNPLDTRRDFVIEAGQKFVANGDWYNPNEVKKPKKEYKDRGFLGADD